MYPAKSLKGVFYLPYVIHNSWSLPVTIEWSPYSVLRNSSKNFIIIFFGSFVQIISINAFKEKKLGLQNTRNSRCAMQVDSQVHVH